MAINRNPWSTETLRRITTMTARYPRIIEWLASTDPQTLAELCCAPEDPGQWIAWAAWLAISIVRR
ncbi:hypothetical protein [Microbacterium sp.]|uniref:hypothetical protein n=1 Tax=Microbacterium sp. TaxID=51671 RepID=UPI003561F022